MTLKLPFTGLFCQNYKSLTTCLGENITMEKSKISELNITIMLF